MMNALTSTALVPPLHPLLRPPVPRAPRPALFNRHAARAAPAADAPAAASFAGDVAAGLAQRHKAIPCTWLYDHLGSVLFERITQLDEYYLARSEQWLLERVAAQIAAAAGRAATLVELGSGACRKTATLLNALDTPQAYVPIDLSAQFLAESVQALHRRFPALPIAPLVADFSTLSHLPASLRSGAGGRVVVFFPGSTIGNFAPDQAQALLARIGQAAGPGALLVIGADTTQDPSVLLPAYADRLGVTAAFNKNLLTRINRELQGNFSPSAFDHQARWNAALQRVEMHLVSVYSQRVHVLGRPYHFGMGESIHTESAYKHSLAAFEALVTRAGWLPCQRWLDGQSRFAVHVLERL
jgi:dimethylhistidine N-methyltransferase